MKPYPKYKDSGVEWIGDVPEHWSALRLKWVCNFLYGESLSAQEREDGTIPVYGSNGIVGYHNRSIAEKPCIIVGRKGSFGKVTFSEKKCYPIDTTYYIDCTSTKNYMRWLWYLLPLLKMDEFSRDSAVPGLNREDAYRNIVTLPSSYEQQQIIAYLDRKTTQIDDLISKKQKLTNLLKEERAAIINKAVTKGLNPDAPMKDSGIEWIGEIPKGWEMEKVSHGFSTIGSGTTPLAGNPEYHNEGTTPWINTGDLNNGILKTCSKKITNRAFNDYSVLKIYPIGSLIIAMYGATIGKVSILDFTACTNQACCVLSESKKWNVKYVFYWFIANKEHIVSMGYGGGQPNISQEIIKSLRIPLPERKEQYAIITYLDHKTTKIDQTTSKIEKQVELLKEYRTALISEVVTGKIDVRDGGSNG